MIPLLCQNQLNLLKSKKTRLCKELNKRSAYFTTKMNNDRSPPFPTFAKAPWTVYYALLERDILARQGVFSNSVIKFAGGAAPTVPPARWTFAERRRPTYPAALADFLSTALETSVGCDAENSLLGAMTSGAYAALNTLVSGAGHSGSKEIDVFSSKIKFFNLENIAKLPLINTSIGQMAILEFFSTIVDQEFTFERKVTNVKSDKKLIIASRILKNLAPDCDQVPTSRRASTCEAGFHYGADLTSDWIDIFSFVCSQSYSISKNDPNVYVSEHDVEQCELLDSTLFRHMIRVQSIVKVASVFYEPRKLWQDEKTGSLPNKYVRPVGSHYKPTARKQFVNPPIASDVSSALDIHSYNADVLDLICSVERYYIFAKVATLNNIGVLLACKRFLARFAMTQRTIMSRAMMPTKSEEILLLSKSPELREKRQNLERARKSALINLSEHYRATLGQMIYRLFVVFFNFTIRADPLRPSIHMAALQKHGETTMPDEYINLRAVQYQQMFKDHKPGLLRGALILSSAYAIPTAPQKEKPHQKMSPSLAAQSSPPPPPPPSPGDYNRATPSDAAVVSVAALAPIIPSTTAVVVNPAPPPPLQTPTPPSTAQHYQATSWPYSQASTQLLPPIQLPSLNAPHFVPAQEFSQFQGATQIVTFDASHSDNYMFAQQVAGGQAPAQNTTLPPDATQYPTFFQSNATATAAACPYQFACAESGAGAPVGYPPPPPTTTTTTTTLDPPQSTSFYMQLPAAQQDASTHAQFPPYPQNVQYYTPAQNTFFGHGVYVGTTAPQFATNQHSPPDVQLPPPPQN